MSASKQLAIAMASRGLVHEQVDGRDAWVVDRGDVYARIDGATDDDDDPDRGDVLLRASAPDRSGEIHIHVPFTTGEAAAVADVLCEAARAISPDTYEAIARRIVGELGGSMFDGWMKPGLSRDDLSAGELARVTAFRDAMTSRDWTLAPGWQDMFDSGIGLAPIIHADKTGALGDMHLEYFARADFLELSIRGGQLRFRMFPGAHAGAVVAMLDDLSQPLDPTWEPRINALLRTPLLMDSPDGWVVP